MSEQILDGTGNGFKVKVNSKKQLSVNSVSVAEITHVSSVDAIAFELKASRTLVAASTVENIFHFEYTGDFQFQIGAILFSRKDVALSSVGQASVCILSNATYTSGGTVLTPNNLNLGSSNLLSSNLYSGATTLVIDTALSKDRLEVSFNSNHMHEYKGSLILKKGDTISIIGESINIGDIINITAQGFEVIDII